jgi:type IV secretory pathway TraG/TraD family ATPase VirD4
VDRERSGVISTAQRHTHFLDSPAILRTLTASTLKLAQLKTETLSLYCVIPPERLGSHGRWLRLVAGSAIHAMLRAPNLSPHRVLFLLDEFAQLGRLLFCVAMASSYGCSSKTSPRSAPPTAAGPTPSSPTPQSSKLSAPTTCRPPST